MRLIVVDNGQLESYELRWNTEPIMRRPAQRRARERGQEMEDVPSTLRTPDTLVDEEPPKAPNGTKKALQEMIDLLRQENNQLHELIDAMQKDWVQLNVFYNATAVQYSWCGDYENRITGYNQHFSVLKLEGRSDREQGHNNDSYLLPQAELKRLKIKDTGVVPVTAGTQMCHRCGYTTNVCPNCRHRLTV